MCYSQIVISGDIDTSVPLTYLSPFLSLPPPVLLSASQSTCSAQITKPVSKGQPLRLAVAEMQWPSHPTIPLSIRACNIPECIKTGNTSHLELWAIYAVSTPSEIHTCTCLVSRATHLHNFILLDLNSFDQQSLVSIKNNVGVILAFLLCLTTQNMNGKNCGLNQAIHYHATSFPLDRELYISLPNPSHHPSSSSEHLPSPLTICPVLLKLFCFEGNIEYEFKFRPWQECSHYGMLHTGGAMNRARERNTGVTLATFTSFHHGCCTLPSAPLPSILSG